MPTAERRGTFAPVVLLGLAAAALAAVAGTNAWLRGTGSESGPGVAMVSPGEVASSPLGTALALVVLACWGVVLVTRGRFRRAVAGLALLAGLGYAANVATAPWLLRDHLLDEVRRRTGTALDGTELTAWWWAAVLAAVLLVCTTALGALLTPHWPEMGARYDAPVDAARAGRRTPETGIDMWKALDEGRDPTA